MAAGRRGVGGAFGVIDPFDYISQNYSLAWKGSGADIWCSAA
jgi:hypothetical protein